MYIKYIKCNNSIITKKKVKLQEYIFFDYVPKQKIKNKKRSDRLLGEIFLAPLCFFLVHLLCQSKNEHTNK